jgi:CBS domain containing-hemolysin-like protein
LGREGFARSICGGPKPSERKPSLYTFLVFSPLLPFLGEIVPKSVYQQKAELGTPVIVLPHRAAFFLFLPIIFLFSQIAHLSIRIAGGSKAVQSVFLTPEQLRAVL